MELFQLKQDTKPSPGQFSSRPKLTYIAFTVSLLGPALCSGAQETPASHQPPTGVQKVEVTGAVTANGERVDANAAKFVLTRDDLVRFGDATTAEVLSRIPSVTVVVGASGSRDIRLRGLGSGYTQILINGDPVPQGFSIDSISPELIDRIEVVRSATAESSTQSIAGSINIVLRRINKAGASDLKLTASGSEDAWSSNASYGTTGTIGGGTYSLASSFAYNLDHWASTIHINEGDGAGHATSIYRTYTREDPRRWTLGLTPRWTFRPDDAQSLDIEGLVQWQHVDYSGEEVRRTEFGIPPEFASNFARTPLDISQIRVATNWETGRNKPVQFETKAAVSINERRSDSSLDAYGQDNVKLLQRNVVSRLLDRAVTLSGKYSFDLADSQRLKFGWDGQTGDRFEKRIQDEESQVGYPTEDLDERYQAQISRLALFVQDEWRPDATVSIYGGVRWEGLWTRTRGIGFDPVSVSSGVVSPVAQILWKIPQTKDQVRISLARTYKAPTASDIVPRRWIVNDNSAVTPNTMGNPELRPELSWGIDAGLEHYLPRDGFIGVNAYVRRIDGVILQRVREEGGVWISTPENSGRADSHGIEVELKGKLKTFIDTAQDIELRTGMTRNWSSVDSVPGPGNRLASQPSLTATAAFDWRLPDPNLMLGASLRYDRGDAIRKSTTQTVEKNDVAYLDVYTLWTISKSTNLRININNLFRPTSIMRSNYQDSTQYMEMDAFSPAYRMLRMRLEMKL